MQDSETSLEEELAVFERQKTEWLYLHSEEFVVIMGTKVLGFFPDFESAFRAGFKVAGLGKNFLVKQVLVEEPVYVIF
jgi:hypothetical protein